MEEWKGETFTTGKDAQGWFEINTENQLKVNVTGGSGQRFVTAIHNSDLKNFSDKDTLIWELTLMHDFTVSSSLQKKNYSRLILCQNTPLFSNADTLLYLEFSDRLLLIYEANSETNLIGDVHQTLSPSQWHNVKVQKAGDKWNVYLDEVVLIEAKFSDHSFPSYSTGLLSSFSSSARGQHFYYDNFIHSVRLKALDTQPPFVVNTFLPHQDTLKIEFNELLSGNANCEGSVMINGLLSPYTFSHDSLSLLIPQHFEIDSIYNVALSGFCDKADNHFNDSTFQFLAEDLFPPSIDSLHVKSDYVIDLFFNEAVSLFDLSSVYLISKSDTINVVDTLRSDESRKKTIVLQKALSANKSYELHIDALSDTKGNTQNVVIPFYNDTRAPKLESAEIRSPYFVTLYFDEPIASHHNDPFNYVIGEGEIPDNIQIRENQIDINFKENVFEQDAVYTLNINAVQDLFGNEMKTKTIVLEYDTIEAQILNTFQGEDFNTILFDEKIVAIDSSTYFYLDITCPTSMVKVERTPTLKLFGVEDENQNVIDSVTISFDENEVIQNIFFLSDSSIRIVGDAIQGKALRMGNSEIDSLQTFLDKLDFYFRPKFIEGEQRVLRIGEKDFTVAFKKNEIQSIETSTDYSIVLEFENALKPNCVPFISAQPQIEIQSSIIEGDQLHLFFKEAIKENEKYHFIIEDLISCENKILPHYSFSYTNDTQAPFLTGSKWKNRFQLLLDFNEEIDESSLEKRLFLYQNEHEITDYSIKVDAESVEVTFDDEYWKEDIKFVIYEGLEDQNTNTTDEVIEGSVFSISSVEKGDLMITEIFADPSPIVGLPNGEAIEIYNASSDSLSLLSVSLLVGDDTLFFENKAIAPEEYAILVPSTKVEIWSEYSSVIGVNHWSALNNSGEIIQLYNAQSNAKIDSVNYDLSSYQDELKAEGGYTLEKRDLAFDCHPFINWKASQSEIGGTLGRQNSVFETIQDTVPATIVSIEVVDEHNMLISFDKSIYMFSTESTIKYRVGNVDKSVDKCFFVDNSTLKVLINEDLPKGVLISLIVDNFQDCFNNILLSKIADFVIKPKVNYQQLLITELMIDHSPINKMPDSEYIEVYNNSDLRINMDKCIMLVDGDTVRLPDNWIFPRNYAVLVPSGNKSLFDSLGIPSVGVSSWENLLNESGEVALVNEEDEMIHSISYTLDYYHDQLKEEGGWSIEMRDLLSPCVGVENWQASENENGGTPGVKNSIEETVIDHQVPILEYAFVQEEENKVVLNFSEVIALTSQTEIILDDEKILFDKVSLKGKQLTIDLAFDIFYQEVSISTITDCSGNLNSTLMTSEILYPSLNEDVHLSEVLYDPSVLNTDFLEVYFNVKAGEYINLKEWSIGRVREGVIEQMVALSKVDDYLFSSCFMVFTKEQEKLLSFYPKIKKEDIREINLPSFPNEEGNVVLLYKGEVHESYDYSEKHHQAFLNNTEDISLERIDFTVSSSNPNNWTSATESSGFATPTFINSRIVNHELNEGAGESLVFSSTLITTNGDGVDDYLKIENNSSSPLRILRMEIYDIHGRVIYPWLSNYELSSRDFVKWDGVDQEGRRVMGKFLVYYQLVDHNGNQQEQTKIVSVAPWN
ncbi:lamin tail domain-containing protein [Flammeovirga aprica JL-4]|uniref:Lamin tail domain-containing protein n=1 Tax=Flammeovirga aprica JL-4 TaxID=694437 RepID=A0A7X9RTI5_9BACT|nr:lamin tail domain-containing protein [Flammeovirga aprica JL-4]